MSKAWGDGDGEHGVPNKKTNNGMLGNSTFFPSDFGMCKIGNDSSDGGSDKVGKPNKIVIFNNKIG